MRHPIHLAAASLAVLTALILLASAMAIRPPGLPAEVDAPGEAANRALVVAFYEAANTAIASGDAAPLAALVAPGFVDRDVPLDVEPDRDMLVRRLLAVHAVAPGVRLAAHAVVADGDLVIAHVRSSGATEPAFVGLQLDGAWTAWSPVDVLRVTAGRIIERWGEVADSVPPVPLLRVSLEVPPTTARTLEVARVALRPGAHYDAPWRFGPRVVFVETGAVAVTRVGTDGADATPPTLLTTGEHLVLPPSGGAAAVRNGPAPAVLLDLAVVQSSHINQPAPPPSPSPMGGVTTEVIANALWVVVPPVPTVLTLARTTLGLGERIGWVPADGSVLLYIEAGTLDFAATGPVSWVGTEAVDRSNAGVAAALTANDSVLLDAGAAAEVRTGLALPATLLVVTLLPVTRLPDDGSPPLDGTATATLAP